MVGSRIYREVFLSIFQVRPIIRLDAIGRKPDSGGKIWSKIDVFWWFYE